MNNLLDVASTRGYTSAHELSRPAQLRLQGRGDGRLEVHYTLDA